MWLLKVSERSVVVRGVCDKGCVMKACERKDGR